MNLMSFEEFKSFAERNNLLEQYSEALSYHIGELLQDKAKEYEDVSIETPIGKFYYSIKDWEISCRNEYVCIEFSYNYDCGYCEKEISEAEYKNLDEIQKLIVDGVSEICGLNFFKSFYVTNSQNDEILVEEIEVLDHVLRKNYLKKTISKEFDGSFEEFVSNIYFYENERIEEYDEMVEQVQNIFLNIKHEIEDLILSELNSIYWDEDIAYEYIYNIYLYDPEDFMKRLR